MNDGFQTCLIDMFSLCGTFLEVLMQTIGKGESGTFRTVGIVCTKFFFQFALVAADFRSCMRTSRNVPHKLNISIN